MSENREAEEILNQYIYGNGGRARVVELVALGLEAEKLLNDGKAHVYQPAAQPTSGDTCDAALSHPREPLTPKKEQP